MILVEQVELRPSSSKENILKLANVAVENLSQGEHRIKAGCRELIVNVHASSSKSARNILYLNDYTFEQLLLPKGVTLNLKYENRRIILGPLLGVFIRDADLPRLLRGDCSQIIVDFYERVNNNGLFYFFGIRDICWHTNKVKAYYWCKEKRWVCRYFPFPEIIYDRSLEKSAQSNASKLRDNITKKYPTVKVLNEPIKLSTLAVFQHLSRYSYMNNHLPTVLSFSYDSLLRTLEKWNYMYIKPDALFEEGILRVQKREQNYVIEFGNENKVSTCSNSKLLIKQLETILHVNNSYVLQNQLDLASFLGNSFVLRVLLQKNASLCWVATGIIAKIAPVGCNTTSTRNGGRVMRAKEVLALSFPNREVSIIEDCKSFALQIGHKVEEQFGSLLELEIDLGIDVTGDFWLINVNDKPSKTDYALMGDFVNTNLVQQTPVLAGFTLAGFDITNRDLLPIDSLPFFTLKDLNQKSYKKKLFLNDYQQQLFNMTDGSIITLQVGVTKIIVEVATQTIHSSRTTLYFSTEAFSELLFYQGESLRVAYLSGKKLYLGPSLGITLPKNLGRKYINNNAALKKRAVLALEKGMFFYCFHLNRTDWNNNLVKAYRYNSTNNVWEKKMIPVPQVIDDRGSYPGPKTVKSYTSLGKVYPIQWINTTRTFGKWETYQALMFFEETTKYVPETSPLTLLKIEQFLQKYKYVYIKHNYGRNGTKVFRIEKTGNYYLCKKGGSVVKSWCFTMLEHLYSFIVSTLGDNVIIQQGITLATIDDSPFDMRILVQKNTYSEWDISALNFRIAAPGAIVTNFAAGARDVCLSPGEALLHARLSWESLRAFILRTVYAMETYFGNLGEIGLDVGLDKDGNLWLIEANSRPSSIAYREVTTEASNRIFGLPLEHACSLVKQLYNNLEA
jgi:hypothetical protein